jgi:integrase
MVYAVNTGITFSNPLSGIRHAFEAPKKQFMATLKPDELPELMLTLSTASIKKVTRCLIEWQLHTMTRPSEAAGAKWCEIDFEKRLWTIPAERMKMKREHIVPLSEQTLNLLEILKPLSAHRNHLFPADRNPRTHANSQTANMALKRMGYGGRLVSHGLRALASTVLNEQGFDPDLIEMALAHVDKNEVRRAYNRADYIERRKPLMTWWSKYIKKASTGNISFAGSIKSLRLVNEK